VQEMQGLTLANQFLLAAWISLHCTMSDGYENVKHALRNQFFCNVVYECVCVFVAKQKDNLLYAETIKCTCWKFSKLALLWL
jgi:hypothetical protein